jgi:hypothetical protein
MLPMWFFIILFLLIGYLLYLTRPTEETFATLSRNQMRKLQYWLRGTRRT